MQENSLSEYLCLIGLLLFSTGLYPEQNPIKKNYGLKSIENIEKAYQWMLIIDNPGISTT